MRLTRKNLQYMSDILTEDEKIKFYAIFYAFFM